MWEKILDILNIKDDDRRGKGERERDKACLYIF